MIDASFGGETAPLTFEFSGLFSTAATETGTSDLHSASFLPSLVTTAWQQSVEDAQHFLESDRWVDWVEILQSRPTGHSTHEEDRHSYTSKYTGQQRIAQSFALEQSFTSEQPFAAKTRVDSLLSSRHLASMFQPGALPQLSLLPAHELPADAAFSAENQTIYLSERFVARNSDNAEAIAAALLEELGHFIDAELNPQDTPGDEGEIFSALVRNQLLSPTELEAAWNEDDSGQITVNGASLAVEYSNGTGSDLTAHEGEFQVDATGTVQVELVFDGGDYDGELALFSLEGLDELVSGSAEYIEEAARRALSNSTQGYIVASALDVARFQGELAENSLTTASSAQVKEFRFNAGERVAFMLIPNGTVQDVLSEPGLGGDRRPLFSLASANPGELAQFSQLSDNLFAVEDLRRDRSSDGDFEDLIVRVSGLEGSLGAIVDLITPESSWLNTSNAQQLIEGALRTTTDLDPITAEAEFAQPEFAQPEFAQPEPPASLPIEPEPLAQPESPEEFTPEPLTEPEPPAEPQPEPPDASALLEPLEPTVSAEVLKDIANERVVKFYSDFSLAEIEALAPPSITLGTQTIYIGTQQVTSINQNPIIRSFDPANPANNWTRTDYEVTGTDGRGMGLFWSGSELYAVFTVDGTQGTPEEDFRRAAQDVEQSWLSSYGAGGGGKIAVLGRLDLRTGDLLDAAHLSAVLSNGNSNSLTVDDIVLNDSGNLVIRATIAFGPRNPDGSRMIPIVENASSPFDYTLEITPDLKRVISTSSPGWVAD